MLRVTTEATALQDVEAEVDRALDEFDVWYASIQKTPDSELPPVGMVPGERAVIKTFLGFHLGIGGHHTPAKEHDAETRNG